MRATVIVAAVDSIGIMIVAAVLGVPFVMAIGVLVFLGAFVPMIGATIAGTVASATITALGGDLFTGATVDTGCAVYVYAGSNVTPDDHYEGSPVVTAARVRFDQTTGAYRFAAGALIDDDAAAEPYTVALTCAIDDPLVDDTTVVFGAPQNMDVNAGQTVTADVLRRTIAAEGVTVITNGAVADPAATGWAEFGNIDAIGHAQTDRFAQDVAGHVSDIADQVAALLGSGWQTVRIVTDHGWLYVPVGAPCDACVPTDPRHGTIMRMRADGSGLELRPVGRREWPHRLDPGFDLRRRRLKRVDPQDQLLHGVVAEGVVRLPGR